MERRERGLPAGARSGDPAARPATQAGLAVSADGARWVLVNASPDLRQQIEATPALQPARQPRSSPIAAVVLTNGDVDAMAGLLSLREGTPFALYAHPKVLDILDANPIFEVLDRGPCRAARWRSRRPVEPADAAGEPLGLGARGLRGPGQGAALPRGRRRRAS